MRLRLELPDDVAAVLLVDSATEMRGASTKLMLYCKWADHKEIGHGTKISFNDVVLCKPSRGDTPLDCIANPVEGKLYLQTSLVSDKLSGLEYFWHDESPSPEESIVTIWKKHRPARKLLGPPFEDISYRMKGFRMALFS